MIRMECVRLVDAAFLRSNAGGRSFLFTYKSELHIPPKLTADTRSISTRATSIATTGRLKREDCRHIKLDSVFSKWKILVRHSDCKDHSMGKEGAEKYRTQNLPNCTCPGIYEHGIAISLSTNGRESRKFDLIIPVYLGQADNVRARLQNYGRDGAHIAGLFSEILSLGFSIVVRWAPMKSKNDAERTEKELLAMYDYAWNERGNGDRRPNDIRRKLESRANKSYFSVVCMMLQDLWRKQLGEKIKIYDLLRNSSGTGVYSNGILSKFFKIWRRVRSGLCDESTGICSVAIGDGSVCTKPPVKGRKRCAEHKGMKINSVISKLNNVE